MTTAVHCVFAGHPHTFACVGCGCGSASLISVICMSLAVMCSAHQCIAMPCSVYDAAGLTLAESLSFVGLLSNQEHAKYHLVLKTLLAMSQVQMRPACKALQQSRDGSHQPCRSSSKMDCVLHTLLLSRASHELILSIAWGSRILPNG